MFNILIWQCYCHRLIITSTPYRVDGRMWGFSGRDISGGISGEGYGYGNGWKIGCWIGGK